jgi:hypothetical protein
MMSKHDVRTWLDTLPEDAEIGIDDGGLCLQMGGSEVYLEIGGLPEEGTTVEPQQSRTSIPLQRSGAGRGRPTLPLAPTFRFS